MELKRTIYRCTYFFKFKSGFRPVRDSKAFKTEQEARRYADELKAAGYRGTVWQARQFKRGADGRRIVTMTSPKHSMKRTS